MSRFPPYTHIPGVTPHPVSSPEGHSSGHEPLDPGNPEIWWTGCAFRRGVELFDSGYYWEAHEAWESTWKALPRSSPCACFVKGLIKLTAGGVKCLEANRTGAIRHFQRAMELLAESRQSGLPNDSRANIERFLIAVSSLIETPPVCESRSDGTPCVIFAFTLSDIVPRHSPAT